MGNRLPPNNINMYKSEMSSQLKNKETGNLKSHIVIATCVLSLKFVRATYGNTYEQNNIKHNLPIIVN